MAELVPQTISIQSLYSWYSEDRLQVNRRYQRKLVWTLKEKQKLIESILRKYPIPAILIAAQDASVGTYEIIDGLQRLHTILSFIEMSFCTIDDKFFDLKYFPTAQSRADEGVFNPPVSLNIISQKEVSTILDYTMAVSVMRNASDDEVNDVFDRINTYGHRLSDQERRQAGVQNAFSNMVRELACTLRGDASSDVLPLRSMPSISIDLPMTKHGYEVKADEVFWVEQGILRSTDLRDSMDEQCIADISACIVGGQLIERSKDALDEIYVLGSDESERILRACAAYGEETFCEELKFCIDEVRKVCAGGRGQKLRDLLFSRRTTNAFPTVFAAIVMAFHELIVTQQKKIADYDGVRNGLRNLSDRIEIGRGAISSDERRRNIDTVKGLIGSCFVPADVRPAIHGSLATTDIEASIRRSEIELPHFELKQGLLPLTGQRVWCADAVEKITKTICAIANNGPNQAGKIIIGVTDKDTDASRIKNLDSIEPKKIGKRYIVGIAREAAALDISVEDYVHKLRDGIKCSLLSEPLKGAVLSNIDFNAYYGLGVLVINIQPQKELSYWDEKVYWREADATVLAQEPKKIVDLGRRFA